MFFDFFNLCLIIVSICSAQLEAKCITHALVDISLDSLITITFTHEPVVI